MTGFEEKMLELAKSRALYPAPLLTHTRQGVFHARVFMRACEWWGGKCEGALITDNFLLFSSMTDRRVFSRWWPRYSGWFSTVSPHRAFLPAIPSGKISDRPSAFVVNIIEVIDVKHWLWTGQAQDTHDNLREADRHCDLFFEDWAWMAAHCKRPVYRTVGGWLFASASDAALFRLYADERQDHRKKVA